MIYQYGVGMNFLCDLAVTTVAVAAAVGEATGVRLITFKILFKRENI